MKAAPIRIAHRIELNGAMLTRAHLEGIREALLMAGVDGEMFWWMSRTRFREVGSHLGKELKMNAPKQDAPVCSKCGQRVGKYVPPDPLEIMGNRVRLSDRMDDREILLKSGDTGVMIGGIG